MSKPRVIKEYDKLTESIQEQIKLFYPNGFDKKLIMFKNAKKKLISALPFEGDEYYYLIKMTKAEAQVIISKDEDYGENGLLKEEVQKRLKDLHNNPNKKVKAPKSNVAEKATADTKTKAKTKKEVKPTKATKAKAKAKKEVKPTKTTKTKAKAKAKKEVKSTKPTKAAKAAKTKKAKSTSKK